MFWMEGILYGGGNIGGPPNGKSIDTALTHANAAYGFGIVHSDWSDPAVASQFAIEFPLWFATACFALFPILWLITRLRRQSTGAGCAQCGYDLTGNASGKCPECGTA